jgi:hypothetical protein
MLTVENIMAGREVRNVWAVNEDAEYHESGESAEATGSHGIRDVPTPAASWRNA